MRLSPARSSYLRTAASSPYPSSVVSITATSEARRSRGRSSSRSPSENAGARFGTRKRALDTGPASRCPLRLHALGTSSIGGTDRVFVFDQPSDRILSNDRHRLLFRRSGSRGLRHRLPRLAELLPFCGRWPGEGRAARNLAPLYGPERGNLPDPTLGARPGHRGGHTTWPSTAMEEPCVAQASSFDHAGGTVA